MVVTKRDEGWAWVALLVAFYSGFVSIGFSLSHGIYSIQLAAEFDPKNENPALMSGIMSLQIGLMFMCCPIASIFVEKLGFRITLMIGAVLSTAGFVGAGFSTSIALMYVTFSVIGGIGLAFCLLPSHILCSRWFTKYAIVASGITLSSNAFGTTVNAMIADNLLKNNVDKGWRYGCFVEAGFCAVVFLAAILLQNPPDEESPTDVKNGEEMEKDSSEMEVEISDEKKCGDLRAALGNFSYILYLFTNTVWPSGVVVFYLYILTVCVPLLGDDVALLFVVISLADGTSRIISGAIANVLKSHPGYNFGIGICLNSIVIMFTPWLAAYVNPFFLAAAFGITFGTYLGTIVTTTGALFPDVSLPVGYGGLMLCNGIGFFAGAPIAGLILEAGAGDDKSSISNSTGIDLIANVTTTATTIDAGKVVEPYVLVYAIFGAAVFSGFVTFLIVMLKDRKKKNI